MIAPTIQSDLAKIMLQERINNLSKNIQLDTEELVVMQETAYDIVRQIEAMKINKTSLEKALAKLNA